MEGFKQGSDIICSFLKFKEWIKGRSVESGGPVRGSRKSRNNNSPGIDQGVGGREGEVDPGGRVVRTSCLYLLSCVADEMGDF